MASDIKYPSTETCALSTTPHTPFAIPRKPIGTTTVGVVNDERKAPNLPGASLPRWSSASRIWQRSSKRTRTIAIGLAALLIALILGLAAGLSLSSNTPSNLPLPSQFGGPYTGDLTYYAPGLGACGVTNSNGDKIVAVSYLLYDAVQNGSDPNSNQLCGKRIRVSRSGGHVSVDLTVVDRCTGCASNDLDVTEDTFAELADVTLGRVLCEWSWLDEHGN